MTGRRRSLRNVVAFAASAMVHLLALAVFLVQGVGEYQLPQPPQPPMEVEITPPEQIIPPERLPPIPETPATKPVPPAAAQPTPQPTPPKPQPPVTQPTPAPPAPVPSPPAPIIARPTPTVEAPRAAPLVARQPPRVSLNPNAIPEFVPEPAPAPTPAPTPAAPAAPPKPAAVQAPATAPGPQAPHLNIHKSEKEAPAGVPTLPMAPSPNQPPPGGRQAEAPGGGAAQGGGGGGSRLQGLVPYPGGVLPNGGPGLRGSLVGCANAQAVGLSSVERAHCDQRFGAAIGAAPHLDDIAPDRRAKFDHDVEKADRDRAYRNSTTARDLVGLGGVPKDETTTTIKLPQ